MSKTTKLRLYHEGREDKTLDKNDLFADLSEVVGDLNCSHRSDSLSPAVIQAITLLSTLPVTEDGYLLALGAPYYVMYEGPGKKWSPFRCRFTGTLSRPDVYYSEEAAEAEAKRLNELGNTP